MRTCYPRMGPQWWPTLLGLPGFEATVGRILPEIGTLLLLLRTVAGIRLPQGTVAAPGIQAEARRMRTSPIAAAAAAATKPFRCRRSRVISKAAFCTIGRFLVRTSDLLNNNNNGLLLLLRPSLAGSNPLSSGRYCSEQPRKSLRRRGRVLRGIWKVVSSGSTSSL